MVEQSVVSNGRAECGECGECGEVETGGRDNRK